MPDAAYDRDADRAALLKAMLLNVPFDGWSEAALKAAARDGGLPWGRAKNAFPGGAAEALALWLDSTDRAVAAHLAAMRQEKRKLRERVALALDHRLALVENDKAAVRAGLAFLMLPQNAALGARLAWRSADSLWRALGDAATDFSYYTKRASLAALSGAVLLYWLEDASENRQATRDFIARRLDDLMAMPRLKARLQEGWRRAGTLLGRSGG